MVGDGRTESHLHTVKDPVYQFYFDVAREEAEKHAANLRAQSLGSLFNGSGVYAGWMDVPLWYMTCREDRAIPFFVQEMWTEQAREAGADLMVGAVDGGHSPFLSRPEETLDFIMEAVGAFKGMA